MLLFGQLPWWTVLSFRFIEAWHCSHGTSISPQSLVTWVSTSFSASSWLQPLQVAFTFPSNCSAKMLRQKPNLGCLHIWQFFTPFFTSWSAQCPQTGWPHGLAICGLTIGYVLKWKESMSSVGRNLYPWNNQSKEFYFSYQISQINSFGTLLTSTFSKNCWDDMFGRLSQVYHVRVMI